MRVAVSIGDLNGVGLEIALKSHDQIKQHITPIYCINESLLKKGAQLLNLPIPSDFEIYPTHGKVNIQAGKIDTQSGLYSFASFVDAITLTKEKKTDAVVTLPIHKEAWSLAGISYKGHTDALRDFFKKDAIMMLGCEALNVALFTEHIPLRDVATHVKKEKLIPFFLDFYRALSPKKVAVLGLNPHAGDGGVLGDEEINEIIPAIKEVNIIIKKEVFYGPLVPDTAFVNPPKYVIAMYHDQGLIPLKAAYFDQSINVSLSLPIIRTSVDHGTAFDIAYQGKAKSESYREAIKAAITMHKNLTDSRQ